MLRHVGGSPRTSVRGSGLQSHVNAIVMKRRFSAGGTAVTLHKLLNCHKAMLSPFCHPGAERLNDVSFTYILSVERKASAFVPQKSKVAEAKYIGSLGFAQD